MTNRARTLLWCSLQISNVNYKTSIILKGNLKSTESLLNSFEKTEEFINKTFQIKTDLTDLIKKNI
jgi:hypothetical protein